MGLQGGIHPEYTGDTYLNLCSAITEELPDLHIHAFSPLEIWQGALTLGLDVKSYLAELKKRGLATLPGTSAEILDDEVRAVICADKINTEQWLQVMESAHEQGIRTTSTIMFGHVDHYRHWARHLLRLRDLQQCTGGFTEFVPLPFVGAEAPMYLKGRSRNGPTLRESILMHAVARLVLYPHITNIQTSWVKMGEAGVRACLNAGANDLGGTLMNESITRAAGASHGQELPPQDMEALLASIGRPAKQRNTLYGEANAAQRQKSYQAEQLLELINTPLAKAKARRKLAKPPLVRNGELATAGVVETAGLGD
jgi:FO synthase